MEEGMEEGMEGEVRVLRRIWMLVGISDSVESVFVLWLISALTFCYKKVNLY